MCSDNASKEFVSTKDGNLVISTKAVKTHYWEKKSDSEDAEYLVKNYTSGMVQSWNKFCFTGGVLEMAIELPGEAESGGVYICFYLLDSDCGCATIFVDIMSDL